MPISWRVLRTLTLKRNDYSNLIHIIAPLVQLNLKCLDERMSEAALRLREVIPQPEGYQDIVGTVGSLADMIATMLTENPQSLLNLTTSLSATNMIQAHYAEVTMAWLRIADPNFTDVPFTDPVPDTVRAVRVNCPVDVSVRDRQGNQVAAIRGNQATSFVNGVGCAINPNGEKVFYLPADAAYILQISATGDGTLSYTVGEFNVGLGRYVHTTSYIGLPIRSGNALVGNIPQGNPMLYLGSNPNGLGLSYPLYYVGSNPLTPDVTLQGDQVATYTVRAECNNKFGHVLGGGTFVTHSFAQVDAYPISSGKFLGWYVDGELVSSDQVYRFPATEDVTVVAHFAEVPLYQIRFQATEGGSVRNVDHACSAGSLVMLAADADEGCLFSAWSADAGEIIRGEGGESFFVVPECDALVTATFVRAGITCPGCGEILPVGVHHLAPCGKFGHYTCLPDYEYKEHAKCDICANGHVCVGGHGYDEGECGYVAPTTAPTAEPTATTKPVPTPVQSAIVVSCYDCYTPLILTEDTLLYACSLVHYTCGDHDNAAEHELCTVCGYFLGDCGEHFTCQDNSSLEDHALCYRDGHGYECDSDGLNHRPCSDCGWEFCVTEGTYAHLLCAGCGETLCYDEAHEVCALCSGYTCVGAHGFLEGQCSYDASIPAGRICPVCGLLLEEGGSHLDPGCGEHYTCDDGYIAMYVHELCEYCGHCVVDDQVHGTGEGECSPAVDALSGAAPSRP